MVVGENPNSVLVLIVMAGKMQENLDETVSSDINNSEERPENNSDGTNNNGRMFSVGNQGRCAKQKSKRVYSKKEVMAPKVESR